MLETDTNQQNKLTAEDEIANYISSGRGWYSKNYAFRGMQLAHLSAIFTILLILMFLVNEILNLNTAVITISFPLYVENNSDENHYVKSLFEQGKTPEESFADYMLQRYVVLRESYAPQNLSPDNWRSLMLNIHSMSSYKAFDDFLETMLPSSNTNSPVLKYRLNTFVSANIRSITMTNFSGKKPTAARVDFNLSICNESHMQCINESHSALIEFDISKVSLSNRETNNFRFRVLNYTRQ